MYPYVVLPPLPEKRVLFSWQKVATDTFDPDFVDRRRAGLEVRCFDSSRELIVLFFINLQCFSLVILQNFLLRIASHPILSFNQQFLAFLQQEQGWQPDAKENGACSVPSPMIMICSTFSTHDVFFTECCFVTKSPQTLCNLFLLPHLQGYFQQFAESKLKSMIGLRELDKQFEQIKNYSNDLQVSVPQNSVLQKRLSLIGLPKCNLVVRTW